MQKLMPKAKLKRSMYAGQDRGDKSMCRRMTWVEATGGAGKGRKRKEAREGRRREWSEGGKEIVWVRKQLAHTNTNIITHIHTEHTHIHAYIPIYYMYLTKN